MSRVFLLLLSVVFIFTGCISQPVQKESAQPPAWIVNPNIDGKNGAVGVAARTYDQKISTKRTLAITRALDELSLQQGVKVELSLQKQESVKNDRTSSNLDMKTSYQSSAKITAHIEDAWEDKLSGELYIWMVLD